MKRVRFKEGLGQEEQSLPGGICGPNGSASLPGPKASSFPLSRSVSRPGLERSAASEMHGDGRGPEMRCEDWPGRGTAAVGKSRKGPQA